MNREQRRALAKKISNKSIRSALRNKGLINRLEDNQEVYLNIDVIYKNHDGKFNEKYEEIINRLKNKVCHVRIIDEEKTKMGVYGIYEDEVPYFHIKELLLKEDKDEQEKKEIV